MPVIMQCAFSLGLERDKMNGIQRIHTLEIDYFRSGTENICGTSPNCSDVPSVGHYLLGQVSMSQTNDESREYLTESRNALQVIYEGLAVHLANLEKVVPPIEEMSSAEKVRHEYFVEHQQFHLHANHNYLELLESLREARSDNEDFQKRERRRVLARLESETDSQDVLAGAVLQIAKQTISYRFGSKPTLADARTIGDQSIVEVIWQGRNHALHWEEKSPHPPVREMLEGLNRDFEISLDLAENNSVAIVYLLDWKTVEDVIRDLQDLIELKPE